MKGFVYASCWVTVLVVIAPLVSSAQTGADDLKIVAGERVGPVSLTMSIDDVLKLLGTPSNVERTSASAIYEWRPRFLKIFQSLNTGEISSIRTIWVFGQINSYRTENGLGVGASEDQAKQSHGGGGCFQQGGATWREYWWPEGGIHYVINTSSSAPQAIQYKVSEIGVRRRSTSVPRSPWRPCG